MGLEIAALEVPHRFGKISAQLERIDALLGQAAGADLALLPECAISGYVSPSGDFDLRRFAEPLEGPTMQRIAELAREHRVALAAPLIELAGERAFNACVVVDSSGARVAQYRKRNPWYPEGWATPGDLGNPVFELGGVRVTIAICFDVHFLEKDCPAQLAAADVLLFPSAWVNEEPKDERDTRLPELAKKFGISVVNANWGPGTPALPGQGDSRIVDASGAEVARATKRQPVVRSFIPSGVEGSGPRAAPKRIGG